MTNKEKTIFVLLTIITLGIYPIVIFRKAKKQQQVKTSLSQAKKVTINVKKLRDLLGGSKNIPSIEYTHKKIKFLIKSKEEVDIDGLQKLKGVSGVFATSKSITLIVGNQASELSKLI